MMTATYVVAEHFALRHPPPAWLLSANAVAAAVALYAASLVNFDYLIADYNLRHCAELASESAALDVGYLRSLGPDALPAIDAALARPGSPFASRNLRSLRSAIKAERSSEDGGWRSQIFRRWRRDASVGSNK